MTLMTINEMGKKIEDLKTERERLIEKDKKLRVFRASEFEDIEKLRPDYDYAGFQSELDRVEAEIRNLTAKAVTILATERLKEYHDMTILEMMLLLRGLEAKEERLYEMTTHLEKERHSSSLLLEYEYINYDISKVEEDLKKTREELEKVRTFLDFYIYELSYDLSNWQPSYRYRKNALKKE